MFIFRLNYFVTKYSTNQCLSKPNQTNQNRIYCVRRISVEQWTDHCSPNIISIFHGWLLLVVAL